MRFLCDRTLGKLAKYLRILGFDATDIETPDNIAIDRAGDEHPLLLSKKTKGIRYTPVLPIRSDRPREQLEEVVKALRLQPERGRMLTRCIKCNILLGTVEKGEIEGRVPEYVYHHHDSFRMCPACGKVYWEGTHVRRMRQFVKSIQAGCGKTTGDSG